MQRTFRPLIVFLSFAAALAAQTTAAGQASPPAAQTPSAGKPAATGKPQAAVRPKQPAPSLASPGATLGPAELTRKVEQTLRRLYAWGSDFKIELGAPVPAEIPYFVAIPVAVIHGTQRQQEVVSISADGRYLLLGQIVDTTRDPFSEVVKRMDLSGRPSKGPSDAPVTLVVYSDFECPHCRELARALSTKIEPKYPRLRIVFKQYPLTQIHPWSMVAALAARCAYEQSPEKFWLLHDLIFENQSSFAPDNAREKLVGFAQQIGLDLVQFNTCLTSDQTWRAVQADVEEARALQIANTPTVFINGRRYLGGQPEAMQQVIDYEMSQARQASRTRPSQD